MGLFSLYASARSNCHTLLQYTSWYVSWSNLFTLYRPSGTAESSTMEPVVITLSIQAPCAMSQGRAPPESKLAMFVSTCRNISPGHFLYCSSFAPMLLNNGKASIAVRDVAQAARAHATSMFQCAQH